MPQSAYSPVVSDATETLSASHRPATLNEYGSVIVAGFTVTGGTGGSARISHATPQPDLLDPHRASDDELAAARHRMVDAYARTLEAAEWMLERRGLRSRKPYLLASR